MMKGSRFWKGVLVVVMIVLPVAPVWAGAGYAGHTEGRAFIDEMAERHGFEPEQLQRWFSEVERSDSVIERISAPAERVLNWGEYREIFLTDRRIEAGRAFMDEHREELRRAQEQMGVSPEVITAIIGVETFYGRHTGTHGVLEALSTLAFDYPPRSDFFRRELEQYLLLTREQGLDPLSLKGSYAGAMGYGQFISSSYRHYAIDFDGDGVVDIVNNLTDAIGSVANYFDAHNWRAGEPVAEPVTVDAGIRRAHKQDELKPRSSVAQLREAGIELQTELPGDAPAKLLVLETDDGLEDWVAFHNFYVITRYNHSDLYAMAVYQLARELSEEGVSGQ